MESLGIKGIDWIKYDMHMCLHELTRLSSKSEHEYVFDGTGGVDYSVDSMGWLKYKLPTVHTVITEVNFFTLPLLAGHLESIELEYPNIKHIFFIGHEHKWLSASYCSEERIQKIKNTLNNRSFAFELHNKDIVHDTFHIDMPSTTGLKLLDHAINFYWLESNITAEDYFNTEGPQFKYWFKEIIAACPCVTEDYIKERIIDNIKLKKQLL